MSASPAVLSPVPSPASSQEAGGFDFQANSPSISDGRGGPSSPPPNASQDPTQPASWGSLISEPDSENHLEPEITNPQAQSLARESQLRSSSSNLSILAPLPRFPREREPSERDGRELPSLPETDEKH